MLPAFAMADMIAGLTGASAILAAIRHVEVNGGKGQVIDLPLFDPLFSIQGPLAANYKVTGKVPKRLGSRFTMAAPRNAYQCKDGKWVALSASTQGMWEQFAKLHRPGGPDRGCALQDQLGPSEERRRARRVSLPPSWASTTANTSSTISTRQASPSARSATSKIWSTHRIHQGPRDHRRASGRGVGHPADAQHHLADVGHPGRVLPSGAEARRAQRRYPRGIGCRRRANWNKLAKRTA